MLRYDLDGDDYDEPYIVTVHKETQKVVLVVSAYDMDTIRTDGQQIISAEAVQYLTHYQFMPAMDGGFFGTGLGLLLGDISETVNSTLNMIMDSGHLSSLGGGFIAAQNFRVKGGAHRIKPGEYKHVNFTGDDVRKGIVPMNFPGPSDVLFSVLGMLIDAGREIASVSDVMTGDAARQNMPVGTVMALIEQGHMVFTASYKRIYRALQDEFEMIARLNAKYLSAQKYAGLLDDPQEQANAPGMDTGMPQGAGQQFDPATDFDLGDMDIQPVADPKSVTSMQKMGRAQFLLELAQSGMVDSGEAITRILDAASIEDVEKLMPKPDPMAQILAGAQEELMVIEIRQKEAEIDETIAKTMKDIAAAEKDSAEADLMPMRTRIEEFKALKELLNERREAIRDGGAGGMAGAPRNASGSGAASGGGGREPRGPGLTALAGGRM